MLSSDSPAMEGCASRTLSRRVDPDLGIPTIKIGRTDGPPLILRMSKNLVGKTRFNCTAIQKLLQILED